MNQQTRHRPVRERDGTIAIHRIDRWLDAGGEVVREQTAIIQTGVPNKRAARAAAKAHQRMRSAGQ